MAVAPGDVARAPSLVCVWRAGCPCRTLQRLRIPAPPQGSGACSVAVFGNLLGPNLSKSLSLRLPSDRRSQPPRPRGCGPPEPVSRTGRRHLPAAQPRPAAPRPRGPSRRHCSPHSASLPAASGRQLQPEEPDAESEEECSVSEAPRPPPSLGRAYTAQGDLAPFSRQVTEGPVDEIIRPRPQGSSPVYECATEGPGFGLPVSLLDRGPQAEGRLALGLQAAGSPPASPCVATRPALLASGHSCAP